MSKFLLGLLGLVAFVQVAARCSVAGNGTPRFFRWSLEYHGQLDERARTLYSESNAQLAAKSPQKTGELVLQMEATVRATREMLVTALSNATTIEAKDAILDGLNGLQLDDDQMTVVARDLALLDTSIASLDASIGSMEGAGAGSTPADVKAALKWLDRYMKADFLSAYPACGLLRQQGSRAIPILCETLPSWAANSVAFENATHLLFIMSSARKNRAWAVGGGSRLSTAQRDAFLRLINKYEDRKEGEPKQGRS